MSRRAALALGLVLALAGAPEGAQELRATLRIVWVDVEGGAATLIVTPAGESLLMDAGWPGPRDAERIASAAAAEGVARIDHLIVSHFHTDHWGGVADLARVLPIGRVYDRGLPAAGAKGVDSRIKPELRAAYEAATAGKTRVLAPGERLPLAGVELEILSANALVAGEPAGAPQTRACRAEPAHPAHPDDETDNANSLGYRLRLGEFEFLDLGDLTWNVEHKLVCPVNTIGVVDVYQATHHGHHHSNNPALLAAVRPTVAVVGNGPRKGCTPPVYAALRATPGLADVFQLHRNVTSGPADNTAPEFIANDAEDCRGLPIRLELEPDGTHYTLEIPSQGTRRRYAVKGR